MFIAIAVFATIGGVGYLAPAHRLPSEPFHSLLADGGVGPLIAFGALVGILAALFRRGFGVGFVGGALAVLAAVLAVAPVLLVHLLGGVETSYGDSVFDVGVIGTFLGGCALIIVEPIVFVGQRRALELEDPPGLARAHLVRR